MKNGSDIINITEPGTDFVPNQGIGPVLSWHGQRIDLRRIKRSKAEEMAKDPYTRYIQYSPERIARDAGEVVPASGKKK